MSRTDDAVSTFRTGYNCSSSILSAFGGDFGLSREQCLRIGCAFGGGIARQGGICGAVSGALMVLGLKHGQVNLQDADAKKKTYALAKKLMDAFAARNGSVNCRDLLGCDISTDEGLKKAMAMNFHTEICPRFVKDAAEILEGLL